VYIINILHAKNGYKNDKLYNPAAGDTYRLRAKRTSENKLHFGGYLVLPLIEKTIKFKKDR